MQERKIEGGGLVEEVDCLRVQWKAVYKVINRKLVWSLSWVDKQVRKTHHLKKRVATFIRG